MILLENWWVIEAVILIGVFAFILWQISRSVKPRRLNQTIIPETFGGKIAYFALYVLRVMGVGLGSFLLIVLVVMIERNIYSVITETMPAPSEVITPHDLSFDVRDVTFASGDGPEMSGWFVPSQNGVIIILLHAYGGNRTNMLWHAEQLVGAGYGVLMYDERASGESDGAYRSYGWEDPRDVAGAIRFIEAESGNSLEGIGIAGCSTGAQIALQSASYYPELEAVWADGPSSVRARDLPAPRNPIMALLILGNYLLDWMYELKLGIDAPPPMIDVIGNIMPRPIMLVGGGQALPLIGSEGDFMLPHYASYAGSNARAWVIPEAVHCDGPVQRPAEYAERMVEFFDTAFGITR